MSTHPSSAAAQQLIDSVSALASSLGPSVSTDACRKQASSTLDSIKAGKHHTFRGMDAAASAATTIQSALSGMLDRVDGADLSTPINQARLATGLHHIAHQLRPLADMAEGGPCAMPREVDAHRLNVGRTVEADSKMQCASFAIRHDAARDVFSASLPYASATMYASPDSFPCGVHGSGAVGDGDACAVSSVSHSGAHEALLGSMIRPPLTVSDGELHEPWDK